MPQVAGWNSQRVIVVGGSGFIGSKLATCLIEAGVEVLILDREMPPDELAGRCEYNWCDVADRETLRGKLNGCSTLFLLAAVLAKRCIEDPNQGWATNVGGTANVLGELGLASPGARVLFASTGAVYPPQLAYPVAEDAPKEARSLYAGSKLAGEDMVAAYAVMSGAPALVMRFFTVYGPGPLSGDRGHFVGRWLELALAGEPLSVFGDGSQTVDLTHVSDVVTAFLLGASASLPPGATQTYNIGSGIETKISDIADWIRAVRPEVRLNHLPEMQHYGLQRQFGDIRRAVRELGYAPVVHPRDGITSLVRAKLEPGVGGETRSG